MSVWSVTEESVRQLEGMADQLEELAEEIRRELAVLQAECEEQQDGLGAHGESLRDLVREMEKTEKEAAGSVTMLTLRLEKSAMLRRMHLEQDPYRTSSNGGVTERDLHQEKSNNSSMERDETLKQFLHQNVQKDRIPKNGVWSDPDAPGNSHFTLNDDVDIRTSKGGVVKTITGRQLKEKYGIDGVDYIHNEPVFTPFVDQKLGAVEVEEIPSCRDGAGGTYDIAVKTVAQRLGWSAKEVEQYMEEHRLTWHETAGRRRILPVPTEINEAFKHTGGISKQISMEAFRDGMQELLGDGDVTVLSPSGFRLTGVVPQMQTFYAGIKKRNTSMTREEKKEKRKAVPRPRNITFQRPERGLWEDKT